MCRSKGHIPGWLLFMAVSYLHGGVMVLFLPSSCPLGGQFRHVLAYSVTSAHPFRVPCCPHIQGGYLGARPPQKYIALPGAPHCPLSENCCVSLGNVLVFSGPCH